MNLRFTEALLVAEWVFGPFDTENDLSEKSYRDSRIEEAIGICYAVRKSTLAEVADALRDVIHHGSEEHLDLIAGHVLESARRILSARPPFYDLNLDD